MDREAFLLLGRKYRPQNLFTVYSISPEMEHSDHCAWNLKRVIGSLKRFVTVSGGRLGGGGHAATVQSAVDGIDLIKQGRGCGITDTSVHAGVAPNSLIVVGGGVLLI